MIYHQGVLFLKHFLKIKVIIKTYFVTHCTAGTTLGLLQATKLFRYLAKFGGQTHFGQVNLSLDPDEIDRADSSYAVNLLQCYVLLYSERLRSGQSSIWTSSVSDLDKLEKSAF